MKFTFLETKLSNVYIVEPQPIRDYRGLFIRVFCKEEFRQIRHTGEFVQINHSITREKGTVRGFHYQLPPIAEAKLIRCIRGRAFDVIVDIRKDSPTFGKHITAHLSSANKKMIYIPAGFAHGFCALKDGTEFLYQVSSLYSPVHEGGILWNDPDLAIKWPYSRNISLSDKDKKYPRFKDISF